MTNLILKKYLTGFYYSLDPVVAERVKIDHDYQFGIVTIYGPKFSKRVEPIHGEQALEKELMQLAIDLNYHGV